MPYTVQGNINNKSNALENLRGMRGLAAKSSTDFAGINYRKSSSSQPSSQTRASSN